MAPLSNICKNIFLNSIVKRNGLLRYRLVSTTGKKEEATATSKDASKNEQTIERKIPDFSKPFDNDNWISYGFDTRDKGTDRFRTHFYFFLYISFFCFGTAFIYQYYPDLYRRDWARREAFIRLHEREMLGLEPIDPNFINPDEIILPPDEELSEEDIVI